MTFETRYLGGAVRKERERLRHQVERSQRIWPFQPFSDFCSMFQVSSKSEKKLGDDVTKHLFLCQNKLECFSPS